MSLIMTNPANDTVADLQAAAAPFRRTRPAPAFRPEIGRSLRMHPRVAVVVALTVLIGAVFFGLTLKPSYLAESRIYIEPAISSPLSDPTSNGLFDSVRYDSYLQQQMQTAVRVDILKAALESLPAGTYALPGEPVESAAHRLSAALKVARVTTSYQMSIGLTGSDPRKTAAVVNAVTTAYLDAGRRDELSHSTSRAQILTEERDRITRELADARTEQASLGAALGEASPGGAGENPYDTQLAALRGELITARQAHDAAAAQLTSVAGSNATAGPGMNALATEMAANDAGLASLNASINQRRATLEEQMAGMTPNNPAYKLDQDELADLDKVLSGMQTQLRDQAARRLEDKLRAELQRTGDMEARLNGELAHGTAAATGAAPKLERSQELTAEMTRLNARFATIDDALRTLELETHGMPMAHLSLAAAVPAQPEASKRKLVLLAALPLALLAACIAVAVLHRRERRIYIAQDMEDLLGFTPIAVLPARSDVSAPVLEEYVLRLAGGIENAYRTRGARTFVLTPVSVTTALDFLLEHLAAKLTALGLDVATVRAADMLDGAATMTALTTSGAAGQHEGRMASALDQLKAGFDLIFIAAPSLLTSAEAEYVARSSDATILVAQCGVTLKEELTAAAVLLERLQVTGVGTVLDELALRYADRPFRTALASVQARLTKVDASRRVDSAGAVGRPEMGIDTMPATPIEQSSAAAYVQPAAVNRVANLDQAPEPSAAVVETIAPVAEPMIEAQPGPLPLESEAAVIHPAFEHFAAPAEPIEQAASPAAALMAEVRGDHHPDLHSQPHSTEPVWPAAHSRTEASTEVRAFEQELLSAKGTSVFLTPRAAERRVERLEPLGTQDSLAPAAEMLAASFGALPMEIEPTPADVLYPEGTTASEAEALRMARANREALASGKLLGPTQEPLQMDEIRRLLNPVKAETTIETRNGKDMIGARAVSEAARQTQLAGWTPDGDAGMSAKKNWFQKLFQRDAEPLPSMVPPDDEEESSAGQVSSPASRTNGVPHASTGKSLSSSLGDKAVALVDPPLEAAASSYAEAPHETRYEDELVVAETNSGFRPVARMVSLLTPMEEPVVPAAATVAESAPVKMAAPAVPPKSITPAARRPKSFFELTQARRRPALAALVAERAIAVAATPSMLQETVPVVVEAHTHEAHTHEAHTHEVHTQEAHAFEAPAEISESLPEVPVAMEPAEEVVEAAPVMAAAEEESFEEGPEAALPEVFVAEEPEPALEASSSAAEVEHIQEPIQEHIPEPVSSPAAMPERYEERVVTLPYRVAEPARRSPAQWPSTTSDREYPVRARLTEETYEQEPRLETRADSRMSPLDPALSRRWGLLSRYQQTERTLERNGDDRRGGRE